MAKTVTEVALQRLHALAEEREADDRSDQHLLERFVTHGDEVAFGALMDRHGPMVLGIGRRTLPDEQSAEDLLQATFLVLARNAARIRKRSALGGWLHGVAVRLARKSRTDTHRARRSDSRPCPQSPPDPVGAADQREAHQILDEELRRLPERYRLPLVLCYLEGQARGDAARQLGRTEGQLKGLLERGRERLRAQLVRRGLAPTVASGVLTDGALATPIPRPLVTVTIRCALRVNAGVQLRECGASDTVTRLTDSGFQAASFKKLIPALVFVLGLGGLGLGAGLAPEPPGPIVETVHAPAPRAAAGETLPNEEDGSVPPNERQVDVSTDPLPRGAVLRFGSSRLQGSTVGHGLSFSPDGKRLATAGGGSALSIWDSATGQYLETHSSHGTVRDVFQLKAASGRPSWLSDDGHVLLNYYDLASDKPGQLLAFDVSGVGEEKPMWTLQLKAAGLHTPVGCYSSRGKEVVIHFSDGSVELWDGPLGKCVREFPKVPDFVHRHSGERGGVALSPDGQRLALLHRSEGGTVSGRVVDVHTGKDHCTLRPLPLSFGRYATCFSPDGRRVAQSSGGAVRIWDADTGADACPLPGHRGSLTSLAVIDDKTLVTTGTDFTVRAWNPTTGAERWRTSLPALVTVAFTTPDGMVMNKRMSWSEEKPARCIDPMSGREKPLPGKLGEAKRTYPMAVSADGKKVVALVVDDKNPAWEVWSWPAGDRLMRLPIQPPDKLTSDFLLSPWDAHFSPDGRQFVAVAYYLNPTEQHAFSPTPAQPFIERWDLATGKMADRIKPGRGNLPQLLSGGNGIWSWTACTEVRDALTGRLVATLPIPGGERMKLDWSQAAAVSADGKLLAVSENSFVPKSENRILVFDLKKGERVQVLSPGAYVTGLRFLPDNRLVSLADVATVWDVTAEKP